MRIIIKMILFTGLGLIGLNSVQAYQGCEKPKVMTLPIPEKSITSHSALFVGKLYKNGASIVTYYFEYGPYATPFTFKSQKPIKMKDNQVEIMERDDLLSYRLYSVRLIAKYKCHGKVKTVYGNEENFATKK